jgi:hypothetical protein
MRLSAGVVFSASLLLPFSTYAKSPFAGRWDFATTGSGAVGANWLGVTEKSGKLDVWFQPTGGHVHPVTDFKTEGAHMTLTVSPASGNHPAEVWELDAQGDKLTGTQKRGDKTTPVSASRAPELNRPAPKSWSKPEALFNGKNLDGWAVIGDPSKSHWIVQNGELVNQEHGANIKTTRVFNDFKLHFEVNCPDDANSGMYLRGRYELQLEYVKPGSEPPERSMGAIYGRIPPSRELPRTPGQWETFDVELTGRTLTVSRNGVMTIDHKQIEGITGGALDANEGEPGPFYIQGDHTGGLKFRNVTVETAKK